MQTDYRENGAKIDELCFLEKKMRNSTPYHSRIRKQVTYFCSIHAFTPIN